MKYVILFITVLLLLAAGGAQADDGYKTWGDRPASDLPPPVPTPVPLDVTFPNYVNPWLSEGSFNTGRCSVVSGWGWSLPLIWPVDGPVHPQRGFRYGHRAIDILVPDGTEVRAAASGVVIYAGFNINGYGNLVVLAHGSGYQTFYAHLSQVHVECGEQVDRGEIIGLTGQTGGSSFPHLHFEVRNEARTHHPLRFLNGRPDG